MKFNVKEAKDKLLLAFSGKKDAAVNSVKEKKVRVKAKKEEFENKAFDKEEKLFNDIEGKLGRKTGIGFYDYRK